MLGRPNVARQMRWLLDAVSGARIRPGTIRRYGEQLGALKPGDLEHAVGRAIREWKTSSCLPTVSRLLEWAVPKAASRREREPLRRMPLPVQDERPGEGKVPWVERDGDQRQGRVLAKRGREVGMMPELGLVRIRIRSHDWPGAPGIEQFKATLRLLRARRRRKVRTTALRILAAEALLLAAQVLLSTLYR